MGNLYDEEEWEAIIEAVLFTMGKSVELKQLAVAIGQSEEIAKRVVLHLQKRYEEEKRGMRILELENAYQMCTCADYYENLIRVAAAPKKHVLTDVIMETLSIIAYRAAGDKDGDRQDPRCQFRPCGKPSGGIRTGV